jgi:hypothetical protein
MFNKQQLQHLKINEDLKLYLLMPDAGKSIAEVTNRKQRVKKNLLSTCK